MAAAGTAWASSRVTDPDGACSLPSLEDARLRVPELKTPVVSAPGLSELELVVWGMRGVMPAPTAVIEVEAPDVGDLPLLEDEGWHGHGLVEPPLPTIGF